MVRVRGQLDAPLVDIETVKHEYWNRKTVYLPSLAKFQKPKGWLSYFKKTHTPVCVIRRLTDEEWRQIDEKFYAIVSVGMFEHVGRKFYSKYFKTSKHTNF